MVRLAILLILILNLADVVLTVKFIKYGNLQEANFIMKFFLDIGVLPFVMAKTTMVFGACYLFDKYKDKFIVKYGVYLSLSVYLLVISMFYYMLRG